VINAGAADHFNSVNGCVLGFHPTCREMDAMTLITQKWLEDALRHVECAEYVKIPREQFVELVQAARNGLRPVLVHRNEMQWLEGNGSSIGSPQTPPKAV
jgi:predicted DNA-binding protein (UPF0251 family)